MSEEKKLCPLTFAASVATELPARPGMLLIGGLQASECVKRCAWYKDGECAILTLAKQTPK